MIKNTIIDNIYIVHGIRGYEKREIMLKNLQKAYDLHFTFLTESWQEEENNQLISKYFVDDIKDRLSKGGTLCTMVHILAYEQMIANNDRFAIVFENDVCILGNDFLEKIALISKEAEQLPQGFMISLENSNLEFPSWKVLQKNKYLYEATAGRCAGGYLIDKKAAQLMLLDLKIQKCNKVIDWWHNDMVEREVIKMYWAHPPLVEQGSFNGKLSSSISFRNNGFIRSIKWQAQKFYKMYILRIFR